MVRLVLDVANHFVEHVVKILFCDGQLLRQIPNGLDCDGCFFVSVAECFLRVDGGRAFEWLQAFEDFSDLQTARALDGLVPHAQQVVVRERACDPATLSDACDHMGKLSTTDEACGPGVFWIHQFLGVKRIILCCVLVARRDFSTVVRRGGVVRLLHVGAKSDLAAPQLQTRFAVNTELLIFFILTFVRSPDKVICEHCFF